MRSIEERLSASDPARSGYAHPSMDAMISRVVSTRARHDAAWSAFRLKVAGVVAASGLVTGAGIVALSSAGVSLPVLSFAASTHAANGTAPTSMLMPLERAWQFTGGAGFSDQAGSATVYSLSGPSDPAAALSHVAQVLGVDIGTPASSDGGLSYTASGPTYAGWLTTGSGTASWGISLSSGSPATSSGSPVATDAFNATALADARQLGSLEVGTPSAQSETSDGTGPVDVTVPILVDGQATEFAYDFTFGADGTLQSADGVITSLAPLGDYPLISPAAGVAQIPAQLYVMTAPLGGAVTPMLGSTTPPTSGSSSTPSSGTGVTGTAPAPPDTSAPGSTPPDTSTTSPDDTTTTTVAPTVVNLTDVQTEYGAYSMTDGSTLLLPVYVYSGDVVGQGWQASFRVVPVDPAYLDLSMVVSPRLY